MKKSIILLLAGIMTISLAGCSLLNVENLVANIGNGSETEVSEKETESEESEQKSEDGSDVSEEASEENIVVSITEQKKNGYVIYSERRNLYHAEDGTTYAEGYCDSLFFDEELSGDYSLLAEAVKKYSDETGKRIDEEYQLLADSSKEMNMGILSVCCGMTVRRADDTVFSVLEYYSQYSGGAHPYSGYSGFSVDVQTGKVLTWSDVFTDDGTLAAAIASEIEEKYAEDLDYFFEEDIEGSIQSYLDLADESVLEIIVLRDSVEVMFNPYTIAPYALGCVTVELTAEEYPSLLNSKYMDTETKDYVEGIPMNWEFCLDANGDGTEERYYLWDMASEDCLDALNITLNDVNYEYDRHGYRYTPYLVSKNGTYYLYVDISAENDSHQVDVFRLTGDDIVSEGQFYGFIGGISNPDSFYVTQRVDVLSTYNVVALHYVGENGIPQAFEEHYYAKTDVQITSTVELTGKDVNGEDVSFPAGTVFRFSGTNKVDYLDLISADGVWARFEVNVSWPMTINGVDAESCFEILYFAG